MYTRAVIHSLAQIGVLMNVCDDLMILMSMMQVLDLRIAGIASVVTSRTIAVVAMVIASVIAVNHLLLIYALVHPKIGH